MEKINLIGKALLKWFIVSNIATIVVIFVCACLMIANNPGITEVQVSNSINYIALIIAMILGFLSIKKTMNEKIEIKKPKTNIIFYLFIILGVGTLFEKLVYLTDKIFNLPFEYSSYTNNFNANNILEIILVLILTVLVAPITEELTYRYMFNKSLKKYDKMQVALITSFLFGIIHGNFFQILPAFIAGYIFSCIYFKTDNILDTIIVHSLNNLIATLMLIFNFNNIYVEFILIIVGVTLLAFNLDLFRLESGEKIKFKFSKKTIPLIIVSAVSFAMALFL